MHGRRGSKLAAWKSSRRRVDFLRLLAAGWENNDPGWLGMRMDT
jgi:hypothetical protein